MPFALRPGPAPAVTALVRLGIDFVLHPWDPAEVDDGLDLAEHLEMDAGRVVDTVVVDAGGRLVACLLPAGTDLDEAAVADAIGVARVRPALDPVAERATGHPAGAISPLGQRRKLTTVIDVGLMEAARGVVSATLVISSGQPGMAVELSVEDLVRTTGATEAAITLGG